MEFNVQQIITTLIVAGVPAIVAWFTARRTTKVQNKQTDIDHDDKMLSRYNELVETLTGRAKELGETIAELEGKVKRLNEELDLIRGLFEEAVRYIRRVRNWHSEGAHSTFPQIPYALTHLFERNTTEIPTVNGDKK